MMSRKAWWAVGGVALIALPLLSLFEGSSESRHRVATEIVIAEGDREIRNTTYTDCHTRSGYSWNTGHGSGMGSEGDEPFVRMSNGALFLISAHFFPCQWHQGVKTYDVDMPYSSTVQTGDRLPVPREHSSVFDSAVDPKTVSVYFLPEMFRGGVDGWRIKQVRHSPVADAKTPLPYSLEDAFDFLRQVPRDAAARSGRYHETHFQGFRAEVWQVREPCAGFDPQAEGPVVVPQGEETCNGYDRLGWLVGQPNADFSVLDYRMDGLSAVRVATYFRETRLRQGAPGKWHSMSDERRFYWAPQQCFDGVCFRPEPTDFGTWSKRQLYYPKQRRIVYLEASGAQPAEIRRKPEGPR